jgi:hypothetical protein
MPILFLMTFLLFGLTWLIFVQNCTTTLQTSKDMVSFFFDFPQGAHIMLLVHDSKDNLLTMPKSQVLVMDMYEKISLANATNELTKYHGYYHIPDSLVIFQMASFDLLPSS